MSLFSRKKKVSLGEARAMVAHSAEDTRELYAGQDGEVDTRRMFRDAYAVEVTSTMRVLRQLTSMSADTMYDDEFARHWDGLPREQREEQLVSLIQFRNVFHDMDVSSRSAEVQGIYALVSEKVTLFAGAADAQYGTDYMTQLFDDPMAFGVAELDTR